MSEIAFGDFNALTYFDDTARLPDCYVRDNYCWYYAFKDLNLFFLHFLLISIRYVASLQITVSLTHWPTDCLTDSLMLPQDVTSSGPVVCFASRGPSGLLISLYCGGLSSPSYPTECHPQPWTLLQLYLLKIIEVGIKCLRCLPGRNLGGVRLGERAPPPAF